MTRLYPLFARRLAPSLGVLWGLISVIGGGLAGNAQAQTPSPQAPRYQARVIDVVDGDTVHLQALNGLNPVKARLQGIDAPEICQAFGVQSKEALARRVQQMLVTVESDKQDDYGRALTRLYLNGEDINAWLVKEGYAWSFGAKGSKGPYRLEEAQARLAGRGLFKDGQALRPSQFRRQYKPCVPGQPAVEKKRSSKP